MGCTLTPIPLYTRASLWVEEKNQGGSSSAF